MGRFKYIPLFWTSLGVFLFTFKFYFITSYIGSLWSNFFFIFGILSFIFSFYVKGSQVVLPFAGVLRYIYVFYLLWSVLVIVRASVEGAPIEWNMLIYQPDYFWQYWIPFILLFGIRYLNFKDVKCILILSMLVGMFYIILNWEEIFFTSHLNLYNSFIAEEVRKVHAICVRCGNLANHSHRLSHSTELVVLGEKDAYEPLCRECYNKAIAGEREA